MDQNFATARFFTDDHRACDALWATLEASDDACAGYPRFRDAILRHLAMEEEVLFPWFERRTGMTQGPTTIMRNEHAQMRAVLGEMNQAAAEGDGEGVLDHGDTLLMLIQQHNVKEESILYPMCDQVAGPDDLQDLRHKLARYTLEA